jgi:hypothetical protein
MPQVIETTVYQLTELDDGAKQKAREWYRERAVEDDWYDCVYEDFEALCAILGVKLRTRPVRLYGGARRKPCIYFSGFWSQGDSACFEGDYAYAKGAARKIRVHAPNDTELHEIADTLQIAQARNFYQLRAGIFHRGHHHHEYSMATSVERDSPTYQDMAPDGENAVTEKLRDLARWLYRYLKREYEYQTSDAVIDEGIIANEYTFTDGGQRFG